MEALVAWSKQLLSTVNLRKYIQQPTPEARFDSAQTVIAHTCFLVIHNSSSTDLTDRSLLVIMPTTTIPDPGDLGPNSSETANHGWQILVGITGC